MEMIVQWTIDINQYFVIFIDSDSDSDKDRGVERTRGDRKLGWNRYFKVLRNVMFESRVLSNNWSVPFAPKPHIAIQFVHSEEKTTTNISSHFHTFLISCPLPLPQ